MEVPDYINDLKHLLAICNDGKEGYRKAAEHAESPRLKELFTNYSEQRERFAGDIRTVIEGMGDTYDNQKGGPMGAAFRVWMDLLSALTAKDNYAMLNSCITGEVSALNDYDKVLARTAYEPQVRDMLRQQRIEMGKALENLEKLARVYRNT